MSGVHEKSYRCQEIPLEVTGVRLTFEDLTCIVDWLGSGEVKPGEGCIFLASPEKNLWLEMFLETFFGFTNIADKFYENWIAAFCSREECRLLQEPRFKSVITKPTIVAAAVATYLSADARVGVRDITGQQTTSLLWAAVTHL